MAYLVEIWPDITVEEQEDILAAACRAQVKKKVQPQVLQYLLARWPKAADSGKAIHEMAFAMEDNFDSNFDAMFKPFDILLKAAHSRDTSRPSIHFEYFTINFLFDSSYHQRAKDVFSRILQCFPEIVNLKCQHGGNLLHESALLMGYHNHIQASTLCQLAHEIIQGFPERVRMENDRGQLPLHTFASVAASWAANDSFLSILSKLKAIYAESLTHRDHRGKIPLEMLRPFLTTSRLVAEILCPNNDASFQDILKHLWRGAKCYPVKRLFQWTLTNTKPEDGEEGDTILHIVCKAGFTDDAMDRFWDSLARNQRNGNPDLGPKQPRAVPSSLCKCCP